MAAGLADQFELDVAAVRVAIVAASVLAGVGVPLYLAAWLLLPEEDRDVSLAEEWWAQFEGRPAAHEEPSGAR